MKLIVTGCSRSGTSILLRVGIEIEPEIIKKQLDKLPKNINTVKKPKRKLIQEDLWGSEHSPELQQMINRYDLEETK